MSRGGDWLEYEAGEYSAGTDTFQYAVVDALGARATGSVRVGIAPRLDGARAPIAVEDTITVRPGRTIAVRVLANDSDPDGGALTLRSVEANGPDATATVVEGDTVQVEAPDARGRLRLHLRRSRTRPSARPRASSRSSATQRRPAREARGVRHGARRSSDILDEDFVDVEVLRNVFLADGNAADLDVRLVAGYDRGAQVRRDGSIRVAVEDRRRIIPF